MHHGFRVYIFTAGFKLILLIPPFFKLNSTKGNQCTILHFVDKQLRNIKFDRRYFADIIGKTLKKETHSGVGTITQVLGVSNFARVSIPLA